MLVLFRVEDFNPRSPYGERPTRTTSGTRRSAFQSTLPLRGATFPAFFISQHQTNFNPRSPYGERLSLLLFNLLHRSISIHAPLTGSDSNTPLTFWKAVISIHAPLTGSDSRGVYTEIGHAVISIHAPLTGSDLQHYSLLVIDDLDFNPRSPYGERPWKCVRSG